MNRSKTPDAFTMLPAERKAAGWLASIYALRMFGMFMILPVFALHAAGLPGGDNTSLVGLAMGIYGLAQACMQIPLGWASDKVGRRPIIIAGLVLFALGCWLGYTADTVAELVWARALQGAGAISAALSALLADVTRDEVRSKGMAMIGASIGVTFALSLVFSPVLYRVVGLNGLFTMTAVLAIAAIAVVLFILPAPPLAQQRQPPRTLSCHGCAAPRPPRSSWAPPWSGCASAHTWSAKSLTWPGPWSTASWWAICGRASSR